MQALFPTKIIIIIFGFYNIITDNSLKYKFTDTYLEFAV